MLGAPRRAALVSVTVVVGCLAMLLFAAGLARADQMVASWYGPGFEGATTASGEPFDPNDYTAAHRTLPFGTKLIVTYNGRSVVVRINDRGPYVSGRDIDLSQAAAQYIGLTAAGEAPVSVETAAASTPTGPYGGAPTTPETPAPQPRAPGQATPQQAPQTETPQAAPAVSRVPGAAAPSQAAPGKGGAQNAGDEQYASADQYEVESQAAPAPPPPAPVAVPAAPPTPDPSRLETPPAELDTPGSTVERRVVLLVAAPPEPAPPEPAPEAAAETVETTAAEEAAPTPELASKPVPEPAPEPETKPAPKPKMNSAAKVAGISVLPDTGGAPLWALAGGALLAGAGALTFFKMRR